MTYDVGAKYFFWHNRKTIDFYDIECYKKRENGEVSFLRGL